MKVFVLFILLVFFGIAFAFRNSCIEETFNYKRSLDQIIDAEQEAFIATIFCVIFAVLAVITILFIIL